MLSGDLRVAWRRLTRNPGFTTAAVLTLALGIGANTAVFTLVDAALLRPLPFPEPERLMVLWESQQAQGKERERVSAANYLDWRRESRAFTELTAWIGWGLAITGSGEPEELTAIRASSNLFRLAGTAPALGRGFAAEEETPGRDRVVVLSHALWTGRFGADPGIVGRTLNLDGEPHQVIGVMPASFRFPDDAGVTMWLPLAFSELELRARNKRMFNVIGRLAPAADLAGARAELATITGRLAAAHPETNGGWGATVVSAGEVAGAGSRRPLLLLLGAVGFVLLIACGNVGHLFLVRAIDREREMAVRLALGAGPGRLARLLLLETALVVVLGGALGLALAAWAIPLVRVLDPELVPGWHDAVVDGRVLAFGAGLLALVTLACGLVPALRASIRPPAARSDAGRLRRGVIVAEVALSVILLVGAGLLFRSLDRLQRVDPGFDASRVLSATLFLSGDQYSEDAKQSAFFATLVENLTRVPGVEAAGAVTTLPMNPVGIDYDLPFSADGRKPASSAELQEVDFRVVEGDYFHALGIPLQRGRTMDARDRADAARVAVVNETLARRYFAGTDPVGRQVWVGGRLGEVTIVGVVGDIRHRGLAARPRPELYVPSAQAPSWRDDRGRAGFRGPGAAGTVPQGPGLRARQRSADQRHHDPSRPRCPFGRAPAGAGPAARRVRPARPRPRSGRGVRSGRLCGGPPFERDRDPDRARGDRQNGAADHPRARTRSRRLGCPARSCRRLVSGTASSGRVVRSESARPASVSHRRRRPARRSMDGVRDPRASCDAH